ncbi:hypothetical protein TcCL_ESM12880, partial [Trypanosoma cruzi]
FGSELNIVTVLFFEFIANTLIREALVSRESNGLTRTDTLTLSDSPIFDSSSIGVSPAAVFLGRGVVFVLELMPSILFWGIFYLPSFVYPLVILFVSRAMVIFPLPRLRFVRSPR